MLKLIDSASFFHEGEPIVTIIDLDNTKSGLEKKAADSRIQEYASNINPDPSFIYVHILALGAGEYYGANRNSDFFPEENLISHYKTFETSPSYIYRNHINKDPKKSIGKVIFSVYNERMHRVELIAEIDKSKGADIVSRVEMGDFPATSMACRTQYDVCSICGNKAHTRQEYCVHLREQLGKMYPDGKKVMAINSAPLKFFDQSIVVRPADVTSSILQKVASEEASLGTQSSAELAEEYGITDSNELSKQADISKLADLIKEVDSGHVVDTDPQLGSLLGKVKDLDMSLIKDLKHFKLNEVMSTFATLGISPSIAFLAELIAIKLVGDHMEGSGHTIAALIHKVDTSSLTMPKDLSEGPVQPSNMLLKILSPVMSNSSLLPEFVEKRAFFSDNDREDFKGYHSNTNIGFIGNGPYIQKTPFEKWNEEQNNTKTTTNFMKVLNTLLAVGGAALAAKWYITRTIEQKMRENVQLSHRSNENGVKIILVKSASDYKLTYKLAKEAMIKCIRERIKI